MHTIQKWVNDRLIEWGIISDAATEIDNLIVFILIILIAVGIDYVCRYFFLNMFKRLAEKTKNQSIS